MMKNISHFQSWRSWSLPKIFIVLSIAFFGSLAFSYFFTSPARWERLIASGLTRDIFRHALGGFLEQNQFPDQIQVSRYGHTLDLKVEYTIDPELQEYVTELFQQYGPDYGAFVAMDVKTGKILTMVSYIRGARGTKTLTNLTLQARFPAASVFKVVTAAAAIDQNQVNAESIIPFNGQSNTLYKRNVHEQKINSWTQFMRLQDAFARSVNTVFGKLGLYYLGPQVLQDYAQRFGFNRVIDTDLPIGEGRSLFDPQDRWSIVEAASGFTLKNTMSPVQAALIASTVLNKGTMMKPYVIQSAQSVSSHETLYQARPQKEATIFSELTATELRTMMQETVLSGTARDSFRDFFRKADLSDVEVGGKTGSLTGTNPLGKSDWFSGYMNLNDTQIAIAALTIHEVYWRVKPATIARFFIEKFAKRLKTGNSSSQWVLSKKGL